MEELSTKISNKFKGIFSYKKANPHTQWNNLLYVFFVIISILILFSFYLLFKIKNQQLFQTVAPSAELPNLMNEKLLNDVNQSFKDKEEKQKDIQAEPSTYIDPSLN